MGDYGYYGIPWVFVRACAHLWGLMGVYGSCPKESRIGSYAWLSARLFRRLVFLCGNLQWHFQVQNIASNMAGRYYYLDKNWYSEVFEVADDEYSLKILKFNMADQNLEFLWFGWKLVLDTLFFSQLFFEAAILKLNET